MTSPADTQDLPQASDRMDDLLERFPGARRALFSAYHIGGCSSCAYRDDESLAEVCQRNDLDPADVITTITESHQRDAAFLIEPAAAAERLAANDAILLDIRTREEFEAVALPGSQLMTQDLQTALFANPPAKDVIIYDHTGKNSLDTCSWFAGHGIKNVFALRGGIDAYSREIDPSIPRYRLEMDSSPHV